MLCTIQMILEQPLFEKAVVLAGKSFLSNIVNRLSVFDCPVKDSIIDKNIIERGDLFLSGLDQFAENPYALAKFIGILTDMRCSALIITDENASLITSDIVTQCDRYGLPIIMVDRNISYASIMDTINKLTVQKYYHALNASKLTSLRTVRLSNTEKMRILDSINPKFGDFICLITVQGAVHSPMTENDLSVFFMKRPKDIYIHHDHVHYFIFSDDKEHDLQKSRDTFCKSLGQYFSSYTSGISLIHFKMDINLCFSESDLAMDTAHFLHQNQVVYDVNSLLQLLMKLKDTDELYRYHDSLLATINTYKSENDTTLFDTLRQYVRCKGSYHAAAEAMGQHETTIRYRINRLRQILNLEDDIVQFHTCITVLVIIDQIMQKN